MSLVDARELPPDLVTRTGVCVVGGGPAGLTVADTLADHGLEVVVLEAGGQERSPESQAFYEGENIGHPYYELNASRLRFLGGSSNHWEGFCRPLEALDFEERAWVPDSGWPIGPSDLEAGYRRAQELCQLGPFDYNGDSWAAAAGYESYPVGGPVKASVLQLSPPTRFGERYGRPLAERDGADIHLHATAVQIEKEPSRNQVRGIVTADLDGALRRYEADLYVIGLGGLENPRLLLASEVGNETDLVGRFFMEHPHVTAGYCRGVVGEELPFFTNRAIEVDDTRIRPSVTLSPDAQRSEGLLNGHVLLVPTSAMEQERVERDPLATAVTDLTSNLGDEDQRDMVTLRILAEQRPNSQSRVELSNRIDELGLPRLRLNWQLTDEDLYSVRRTAEIVAADLSANGFGRTTLTWPYAASSVTGGHHHMGTTRMHHDPRKGVVDEHCRVHGFENLYVAGSSVFPTGGFANPTLTLLALAVRLGEHLGTAAS